MQKNKKTKKTLQITFYEAKTKTRKGLYIKIKDPKTGGKGLYKYDGITQIPALIEYFKQNQKAKQKRGKGKRVNKIAFLKTISLIMQKQRTKETKAFLKRYGKKMRKFRNIDQQFTTGTAQITRTLKELQMNTRKAYQDLLAERVLDKQLLNILAQNAEKFKFRLYYKTTILGQDPTARQETTIGTVTSHGQTIEDYTQKWTQGFHKRQYIDYLKDELKKAKIKYIKANQEKKRYLSRIIVNIQFGKG